MLQRTSRLDNRYRKFRWLSRLCRLCVLREGYPKGVPLVCNVPTEITLRSSVSKSKLRSGAPRISLARHGGDDQCRLHPSKEAGRGNLLNARRRRDECCCWALPLREC